MFDHTNHRDIGYQNPPEPPDVEDPRDARIAELEADVGRMDREVGRLGNQIAGITDERDGFAAQADDADGRAASSDEECERLRDLLDDALDPEDETWHEVHAAQFLMENPRPYTLSRREWADRLIAAINAEA